MVVSQADALRAAQNLIVASSEFNTLSMNNATSDLRTPGVLQTILQEYNCYNDCRDEGAHIYICFTD
jgi:hypothetical protein